MTNAAEKFLDEIHDAWDSREPWEATRDNGLAEPDLRVLRQYCAALGEDSELAEAEVMTAVREYAATLAPVCPRCGRPNRAVTEEGAVDGPREYHATCWHAASSTMTQDEIDAAWGQSQIDGPRASAGGQ